MFASVFVVSFLALVTMAAGQCSGPEWIEYAGMKVEGSVPDAGGDASVADCQNLCLTKLNCVAIDYTTGGQCSHTPDANEAMVPDASVTHYTAQRTCTEGEVTCVHQSIGQFEFQGQIDTSSGATSIDECLAGCTEGSCTGLAWNPFGEFMCIKTSELVDDKIPSAIYTAFEKVDCTGTCQPYAWAIDADMVSSNNVRNADGDESAFACQLQCLSLAGCVAVDYNAAGECYTQNDGSAELVAEAGTNHYTASQTCETTTEPTSMMSTPKDGAPMIGQSMILLAVALMMAQM